MDVDSYFQFCLQWSFPGALIFLLLYGLTSPWWTSFIGRALFIKSAGVTTILCFSALLIWFGPNYPGRDTLRVVGGTLVIGGVWSQVASIVWEKFIRKNRPRLNPRTRKPERKSRNG